MDFRGAGSGSNLRRRWNEATVAEIRLAAGWIRLATVPLGLASALTPPDEARRPQTSVRDAPGTP